MWTIGNIFQEEVSLKAPFGPKLALHLKMFLMLRVETCNLVWGKKTFHTACTGFLTTKKIPAPNLAFQAFERFKGT